MKNKFGILLVLICAVFLLSGNAMTLTVTSDGYVANRPVSEPIQMLLFGTGLIALAGVVRNRFFK